MLSAQKQHAFDWIEKNRQTLSDWHQIIWHLAEPAWREYKSSAWYMKKMREEGFEVEESSGGMPTAFMATWQNGEGPNIGAYAEYDAVMQYHPLGHPLRFILQSHLHLHLRLTRNLAVFIRQQPDCRIPLGRPGTRCQCRPVFHVQHD
jgi:hypothetical protein